MFKIDCFCEDKNLVKIQYALNGLVLDLKAVPVINATAKNGQVKAITNGTSVALFDEYVKKRKLDTVTVAIARDWLESVGRSAASASFVLREATVAGLLKKYGAGSNSKYVVSAKPTRKYKKRKVAKKRATAKKEG